ncbi:MAG: EAL domain-containing protein, partial [Pseudomonadota bacterium]
RDALDAASLTSRDLALEITESSLMRNPVQTMETLRALRDQGHELSIDDFGTGYSSLQYLQQLPVSEVKIDRSFVRNITSDEADLAITQAMIDLSHRLGRTVTAEGVEDAESLACLRDLRCDKVQGYFLAKPLERTRFESYIKRAAAA